MVLRAVFDALLGRAVLGLIVAVCVVGVGYSLIYGTQGLMWLGLSRVVAGSIVSAVVIVASVVGLYLFAKHVVQL